MHDSTQYAPQDLPETDKDDLFNSQAMVTFLHKMHKRCSRIISNLQFQVAVTRLEEVFLENQVVDVLHNDFPSPSEDGGTITERKETLLKEYQSFTDLVYSKSKVVTHIQWSPFKKARCQRLARPDCCLRVCWLCPIWIHQALKCGALRVESHKSLPSWNGQSAIP